MPFNSIDYRELASCANATVAEAVRNAVCRFVNLIGNPPISVLCSDLLKLSDSTVKLMASAVSHCDTEVLQSFSEVMIYG